jgi:hypothetical protein
MKKRILVLSILAYIVIGTPLLLPTSYTVKADAPCYCTAELWGYDTSYQQVAYLTNSNQFWATDSNNCLVQCGAWAVDWAHAACGVYGYYYWTGQGTYSFISPGNPQPFSMGSGYC